MNITRIEIAFKDGKVSGAQVSLVNGRTVGVNTGSNPEYDMDLASALGDGLAGALGKVASLAEELEEAKAQMEAQSEAWAVVEKLAEERGQTVAVLQAKIAEMQASIGAQSAETTSLQQVIAGLGALGFNDDQVEAFRKASAAKPSAEPAASEAAADANMA